MFGVRSKRQPELLYCALLCLFKQTGQLSLPATTTTKPPLWDIPPESKISSHHRPENVPSRRPRSTYYLTCIPSVPATISKYIMNRIPAFLQNIKRISGVSSIRHGFNSRYITSLKKKQTTIGERLNLIFSLFASGLSVCFTSNRRFLCSSVQT